MGTLATGTVAASRLNARKAMHLLLDNPSPEVGLRRLLRFADWLAEFASVAEHDPSIARRLRELAVHVGRAHGMLPEQWQVSIEATPQDTVDAATQTGLQQPSREDAGGRGGSPYQRPEVAEHPAGLGIHERATGVEKGQKTRRYLGGDNDGVLITLSPYERSLRDLDNTLKRIKPNIFQDPRIKSTELNDAKTALESVNPLVAGGRGGGGAERTADA